MIKKFLLRLLLKWYVKENKTIDKIKLEEEFNCYQFNGPSRVQKVLKTEMTNLMVKYFQAHNKKETQSIIKGQVLMLKILLDRHRQAQNIKSKTEDKNKQVKEWRQYNLNSN